MPLIMKRETALCCEEIGPTRPEPNSPPWPVTRDTWVLWLLVRYGGKHNVFNPNLIIRKQSNKSRLRDLLRHTSVSGRTKARIVLDSRRPKRIDNQAECLVLI